MGKKLNATILFADIMDSLEIANYWDTRKYNNFLNEFQYRMLGGIAIHKKKNIRKVQLVGDELVVFICSKDVSADIITAIELANTLKILWCISSPNRKRVKEGKKIFDLGIGINTGEVMNEYRPFIKDVGRFVQRRKTFEGFTISLAKRIEGFSRQGKYSRIMIGHRTMAEMNKLWHDYEYESMGLQKFKGMSQEVPVFELKSCYSVDTQILAESNELNWAIRQLEHIKIFDPSNIWLLMTLINIYGDKKNHKKVEELCREAISVDSRVASIHFELASSLEDQKKWKMALVEFEKTIDLKGDLWNAYIGKSACLIFLGLYDDCIEFCRSALKIIPIYLREHFGYALYYNIAAANSRKKKPREALRNLKRTIELGGRKVIRKIKKDEDKDFCNLYENSEFKELLRGKLKKKTKGGRKTNK